MPELPEVETTRRSLAPILEGHVLEDVSVRRHRMARRNVQVSDVADRLRGRRVSQLGRIGKFIVGEVDGDLSLIIHLGMSGKFQIRAVGAPEDLHTNVVFRTDAGVEARMVDPRTFGFVAVHTPEEMSDSSIAKLGPDALDALPPLTYFLERLSKRQTSIKTVLLDQGFIAGLGNIYADEVLFRAGVRGDRSADSLDAVEVKAVRSAVRPILRAGLKHGGTSLDDLAYLLPDGRAGEYTSRLNVYGRRGEDCRHCGSPIEGAVLGGRSSCWCPSCQT